MENYGKCIYSKKASMKGYYKCEVTNTIRSYECWGICGDCKYFKMSWWRRLMYWLGERFYW